MIRRWDFSRGVGKKKFSKKYISLDFRDPRAGLQNGFWGVKYLLIIGGSLLYNVVCMFHFQYISIQWRRLSILSLMPIKHSNSIDTHKHGNKEKLSISSFFFLFTCKLVNWKKLLRNQSLNKKSRVYFIDKNADYWSKMFYLNFSYLNYMLWFLEIVQFLKINFPGCIGAFFIPHGGFGPTWMYVGLIGGMLFIIIQLVLIIDFAHSWAESWQAEYSASQVQVIVYINSTRYFLYQPLCSVYI